MNDCLIAKLIDAVDIIITSSQLDTYIDDEDLHSTHMEFDVGRNR